VVGKVPFHPFPAYRLFFLSFRFRGAVGLFIRLEIRVSPILAQPPTPPPPLVLALIKDMSTFFYPSGLVFLMVFGLSIPFPRWASKKWSCSSFFLPDPEDYEYKAPSFTSIPRSIHILLPRQNPQRLLPPNRISSLYFFLIRTPFLLRLSIGILIFAPQNSLFIFPPLPCFVSLVSGDVFPCARSFPTVHLVFPRPSCCFFPIASLCFK